MKQVSLAGAFAYQQELTTWAFTACAWPAPEPASPARSNSSRQASDRRQPSQSVKAAKLLQHLCMLGCCLAACLSIC